MSSSSSDVETLTTARGSVFSAVTRKWKVALSLILLLGVVAAVGVCAAVVVASTSSGREGEREQESTRFTHSAGEHIASVEVSITLGNFFIHYHYTVIGNHLAFIVLLIVCHRMEPFATDAFQHMLKKLNFDVS